jgi:ribonuclease BN (tRNA processing enzyme)
VEIVEGTYDFGFGLEARRLLHSTECLGYRIEAEGKITAYCSDTGICDNAVRLAKNADLFIVECSLKTGQDDRGWPHLNPRTAADMAKKARARKMALMHFNPFLYPALKNRQAAEQEAREVFPASFSTVDDMEIIMA